MGSNTSLICAPNQETWLRAGLVGVKKLTCHSACRLTRCFTLPWQMLDFYAAMAGWNKRMDQRWLLVKWRLNWRRRGDLDVDVHACTPGVFSGLPGCTEAVQSWFPGYEPPFSSHIIVILVIICILTWRDSLWIQNSKAKGNCKHDSSRIYEAVVREIGHCRFLSKNNKSKAKIVGIVFHRDYCYAWRLGRISILTPLHTH